MRERDERNAAALDSLALADGAPLPNIDIRTADEMMTPRMVAAHAGHRSMPLLHQNVKAILQRLRSERRGPTPTEKAVLRSVVRDAQRRSAIGELEAATAETADVVEILSSDGSWMLAFLDRAIALGASLEAQVQLLTYAVNEALDPGSGNPPKHNGQQP
ncbi:hypothetical protein GCM10022222_85730 [Amycolatopsis ultiminotia]|uniref:Uncharacterized protein n=1 Tax=Amycolatopsis ultiminotia TaxID=543629 RepID=A0ABP6YPM2_9PSEU